jgi:Domain of unknown function (DUF1906)
MRRSRKILPALLLSAFAAPFAIPDRSNTNPSQSAYLGFDLNDYPGDDAFPVLRTTFSFTGYWLGPPPGEKRTGWLGKRPLLKSQGFGFAVLFNGRESRNLKSPAEAKQKGALDAEKASKLAGKEGFPSGTIIFLDIEEGGRLPPAYHDYVNAWIDVLAHENFRAGAYCSGIPVAGTTTAKDLQDYLAGRKLTLWVFNDFCPPAPGCVFPQKPPAVAQGGTPDAAIWQFAQSPRRKERSSLCVATYAVDGNCYAPGDTAYKWHLDVNVATSSDPSAPRE